MQCSVLCRVAKLYMGKWDKNRSEYSIAVSIESRIRKMQKLLSFHPTIVKISRILEKMYSDCADNLTRCHVSENISYSFALPWQASQILEIFDVHSPSIIINTVYHDTLKWYYKSIFRSTVFYKCTVHIFVVLKTSTKRHYTFYSYIMPNNCSKKGNQIKTVLGKLGFSCFVLFRPVSSLGFKMRLDETNLKDVVDSCCWSLYPRSAFVFWNAFRGINIGQFPS